MSLVAWADAWEPSAWALYTWEGDETPPVEEETPSGAGLQTRRRRAGRRLHWLAPLTQDELLDEIIEQREAEFEELVEAKAARKLRRKPIAVALKAQPELLQTPQPALRPAKARPPIEDAMQAFKAAERSLTAVLEQAAKVVQEQEAASRLEEDDLAFVMATLALCDD